MVDIDRSGQMVSAARHLGVCGKAVVPTRLNDRCHLVPPQVCHEEEDDDDDDDDDEEEEEEDDEDDSDDEILLSLSAILFNNPGKWRLSLYVGHPGSRE